MENNELSEVKAKLKAAEKQNEINEAMLYAMRIDVRESREKMEAMLGENLALKETIVKCAEPVENWNSWADAGDQIPLHIETPATDAIANELRAEGVEMFAKYIALYNSNAKSHAESFATKLRARSTEGGV